MKYLLLFMSLILMSQLIAHEGHQKIDTSQEKILESQTLTKENISKEIESSNESKTFFEKLGALHLVFLHFPIALINMIVIFDLLAIFFKNKSLEITSDSLIVASAIFTPITALLGYLYSLNETYTGVEASYLSWHMWLGIGTTLLIFSLLYILKKEGRGRLYSINLFILFLLVNLTAHFGALMTFGENVIWP